MYKRQDTTCNNIKLAKNAAKKIINDGASALIGAACPNMTIDIAKELSIPEEILMISPDKFRNNEYTLSDNVFQSRKKNKDQIQSIALKEFDKLRDVISNSGIDVFRLINGVITPPAVSSPRDKGDTSSKRRSFNLSDFLPANKQA